MYIHDYICMPKSNQFVYKLIWVIRLVGTARRLTSCSVHRSPSSSSPVAAHGPAGADILVLRLITSQKPSMNSAPSISLVQGEKKIKEIWDVQRPMPLHPVSVAAGSISQAHEPCESTGILLDLIEPPFSKHKFIRTCSKSLGLITLGPITRQGMCCFGRDLFRPWAFNHWRPCTLEGCS